MKSMVLLLATLPLAACVQSTGVMEAGGGNYTVSTRSDAVALAATPFAKTVAYDDAREFCAAKGAQMFLVNTRQEAMPDSKGATSEQSTTVGEVELRFKCEK